MPLTSSVQSLCPGATISTVSLNGHSTVEERNRESSLFPLMALLIISLAQLSDSDISPHGMLHGSRFYKLFEKR